MIINKQHRLVYDAGEVWRMTERQYKRFIAAGSTRPVSPSQFGTYVGQAFNTTRIGLPEFRDELDKLNGADS